MWPKSHCQVTQCINLGRLVRTPACGGHIAVNKFAGHRNSKFVATNPSPTHLSPSLPSDIKQMWK